MDERMPEAVDEAVVYSVVLRPQRSATQGAVRMLVVLFAVVWTAVGLVFAVAGAWPVLPFFGAEVLLLYGAFWLNQRAGNVMEAINLTSRKLTVRRTDPWGKESDHTFPPRWLQVNLDEPPTRKSPLELRAHGKSLVIGSFLLPEERLQLAGRLRRELRRLTRF